MQYLNGLGARGRRDMAVTCSDAAQAESLEGLLGNCYSVLERQRIILNPEPRARH